MTDQEKIKKFDLIQEGLWNSAENGDLLTSTMAASIIREFKIPSPDGEDPEGA